MSVAQSLVVDSKTIRLCDRRRAKDLGTPTRSRACPSSPILHDYDSNLRRRRESIKGTERMKQFTNMTDAPQHLPNESAALYFIGRLAGVAWGAVSVRAFMQEVWPGYKPNRPMTLLIWCLRVLTELIFSLLSLCLTIVWSVCALADQCHLAWFWACSIRDSHATYVDDVLYHTSSRRCSSRGEARRSRPGSAASERPQEPNFTMDIASQKEQIIQIMLESCDPDEAEVNVTNKENVVAQSMTASEQEPLITASTSSTGDYKIQENDKRPTILWGGNNLITDACFVAYVWILNLLVRLHGFRAAKLSVEQFRVYLSIRNPPITPLSSNDEIYNIDDDHTRFQLTMLFVTDKLGYADFREAYIRRWVMWEAKTRSVLTRYQNRPAWKTLDYSEFDINKHIKHIRNIDLREKSIAEVISELSTNDLPVNVPQWEVWFVDAVTSPAETDSAGNVRPNPSAYSFIASKWNHAYADGVGMMASIVSRLGDEPVSFASLPKEYTRVIPKWQQRCYYLYHTLFAATESVQFLLYTMFGTRPYRGLFSGSGYVGHSCTGVKHYSTPVVVRKDKLQEIARKIRSAADEAFVQDLKAHSTKKVSTAPAKPTINDLLCYCLLNAIGQMKNPDRLSDILRKVVGIDIADEETAHWHHVSNDQHPEVANIIIPMMCRTSLPERMDNFTSLVPTSLPLPPRPCWDCCPLGIAESKERVIQHVYKVKDCIDNIKNQNCRIALFLIMCGICKAMSFSLAKRVFRRAYENMQFCSTNVAAPSIDAHFCDKVVHCLFFWPAVACGSTCGSSWVSLGDEIHVNTVVDEAEFRSAVQMTKNMLAAKNLPELSEPDLNHLLAELANLTPKLVEREIVRLEKIFQ